LFILGFIGFKDLGSLIFLSNAKGINYDKHVNKLKRNDTLTKFFFKKVSFKEMVTFGCASLGTELDILMGGGQIIIIIIINYYYYYF
jgi:hypothetical protein